MIWSDIFLAFALLAVIGVLASPLWLPLVYRSRQNRRRLAKLARLREML